MRVFCVYIKRYFDILSFCFTCTSRWLVLLSACRVCVCVCICISSLSELFFVFVILVIFFVEVSEIIIIIFVFIILFTVGFPAGKQRSFCNRYPELIPAYLIRLLKHTAVFEHIRHFSIIGNSCAATTQKHHQHKRRYDQKYSFYTDRIPSFHIYTFHHNAYLNLSFTTSLNLHFPFTASIVSFMKPSMSCLSLSDTA